MAYNLLSEQECLGERRRGHKTLREVFLARNHWGRFCKENAGRIRPAVIETVRKFLRGRTPELGCHAYYCDRCDAMKIVPHSCKSRFCPSCGKVATDIWAEKALSEILPVDYHHLVFTIPWQLRSLALANRNEFFNMMFRAAADSILEWFRRERKAVPGIYAVLHTFGSDLKVHSHLHLIVTGGGLSLDQTRWIPTSGGYLMPEKGLKKRWRYQIIAGLIRLNKARKLKMPRLKCDRRRRVNFRAVISVIAKLCWYVFIGAALAEIGMTVRYVARYRKRPTIAETRVFGFDGKKVSFYYKDYTNGGKPRVRRLKVEDFIARLIRPIPEKGFRMIRGYGILANRSRKTQLVRARQCLGAKGVPAPPEKIDWRARRMAQTGEDPLACPKCGREMKLLGYYFGFHEKLYAFCGVTPPGRIVTYEVRDNGILDEESYICMYELRSEETN